MQAQVSQEISEEESYEESECHAATQPVHKDLPSPCHPAGHEEQRSEREAEGGQTGESCRQEERTQIENCVAGISCIMLRHLEAGRAGSPLTLTRGLYEMAARREKSRSVRQRIRDTKRLLSKVDTKSIQCCIVQTWLIPGGPAGDGEIEQGASFEVSGYRATRTATGSPRQENEQEISDGQILWWASLTSAAH